MSKFKSEITKLNEIKGRQMDEISQIKNELSNRDRTIKQLQLSEQSISHDFLMQIEKLENKIKVIIIYNKLERKRIFYPEDELC